MRPGPPWGPRSGSGPSPALRPWRGRAGFRPRHEPAENVDPIEACAPRPPRRVHGAAPACACLLRRGRIVVHTGGREPRSPPRSAPSRPARRSRLRERERLSGGSSGSPVDPRPPGYGWLRERLQGRAPGDASGASGAREKQKPGAATPPPPGGVAAPRRGRSSGGTGRARLAADPSGSGTRREGGGPFRNMARGSTALRGFVLSARDRAARDQGRPHSSPQALEVADGMIGGKHPSHGVPSGVRAPCTAGTRGYPGAGRPLARPGGGAVLARRCAVGQGRCRCRLRAGEVR